MQPAFPLDLAEYRIVDLSHAYGQDTIYWPTAPHAFEKTELAYGDSGGGYFYSAYAVCTPEHGGTHLDAPIHFAEDGVPADRIPLSDLIGEAVVIDVSAAASGDPDYLLSVADVERFEARHGRIGEGTIVLMRTDWSRRWPDTLAYMGDDRPGETSGLRFPGFGVDATRLLVEDRKVSVLGIDTASIDYGKSADFMAHRIGAAAGVVNLENLTNLAEL
ncbi:MAG TPA: cyclase family protein, partial [Afifellaceae bacterium]|nr:cyclase family protein [Afifellaceae bacterium]